MAGTMSNVGALANMKGEAPKTTEGVQQAQFSIDDYNTPQAFLDAIRREGEMNILDAVVPLQDAFLIDRDTAINILADYLENVGS